MDDGSRDATARGGRGGGARVIRLGPESGQGRRGQGGRAGRERTDDRLRRRRHERCARAPGAGTGPARAALTWSSAGATCRSTPRAEGPLATAGWRPGAGHAPRRGMSSIRDTQCGFKVFVATLARRVFEQDPHTFVRLRHRSPVPGSQAGRAHLEMPVSTTFRAESTFDVAKAPADLRCRTSCKIRLNDLAGRYAP